MRTADAQAHFFKDARHRVADGGGRRERQIENTERDAQNFRGFAADEFAHAGDFEGGFLHDFGNFGQADRVRIFQRGFDHAWPRYADVDDGVRFARAVKRARHKRVVFHCVAEHDDFGAAETFGRDFRRAFDGFARQFDRIHIDAGARAADIDGAAHDVGSLHCLRNGAD